jgi:SNF2 family DNA or RNA helicase
MALLDCEPDPKDPKRFIPRLLRDKVNVTDRSFYNYQISGAVGAVLKLYGNIDPDALLRACRQPDHPRASEIRQAAYGLNDLLVHGCILADDVGFGKTIMCLLTAFFHTFLYDEIDERGEELFKPIYLVAPASVVTQWLVEIRNHWPFFTAVVSYEDHGLKTEMALHSLSHTAMKEYPSLEAVPSNLRYIWNTKDKKAMTTIIVTSYETNKKRVGIRKTRKIPGVHYKPPRRDSDGRIVWKKRPRKQHYWITKHTKAGSLLIGDEAQKIKNYHTGMWSVIWLQGFRKTLLLSATPIFNSVNVSLGPVSRKSTFPQMPLPPSLYQSP